MGIIISHMASQRKLKKRKPQRSFGWNQKEGNLAWPIKWIQETRGPPSVFAEEQSSAFSAFFTFLLSDQVGQKGQHIA